LDSLQNANLRILTLSCAKLKNLNGVERYDNLTKLRLVCEKLDDINCLKNCSTLALLDLKYCRNPLLFDQIDQIGEIHVRKDLIYPNEIEYTLYKWKQNNSSNPYEFSVDETQFIMENADSRQKNNYVGLIRSNRYEVYILDFSVWILRRPGYIPALTKRARQPIPVPFPLPALRPVPRLVPLWNGIMRILTPIFDTSLFNDLDKYNPNRERANTET
jgi:hypothetical protein